MLIVKIYRNLKVGSGDFKIALSIVRPSMQRSFQVEVEKSNWQDVGGLQDVKKVIYGNTYPYIDKYMNLAKDSS